MTAEPLQVRRLDPRVVASVAALALLGWILQLSIREAAPEGAPERAGRFAERQLQWYAVGALAAALVLLVPYRALLDRAWGIFAASLALLLAVLVVGSSVKGAQRWIDLGPASSPPTEKAKLPRERLIARYNR